MHGRLEPEGETEMPETRVVTDGVEGIYVDDNGEGHHEREQVKTIPEVNVACQEKKAKKLKSQKRKIIRVESEETQDNVRAEGLSFVPSAISVPRKPTFRCDNPCSEQLLSFWQLASVVSGR